MKLILFFLNNILGWSLVVIGIVLLVIPGPGLLMVFLGLIFLSQCYEWARSLRHFLRLKAGDALFKGVSTWGRFLGSLLSAALLLLAGLYLFGDPTVPRAFWFSFKGYELGPKIPAAGYGMGLTIMGGALLTMGALCYSRLLSHREKQPKDFAKTS